MDSKINHISRNIIWNSILIDLKNHPSTNSKQFSETNYQGWQYGTVWYVGTVRFNFCLEVRYAGTVRFFVMVRVRYVDTYAFFVKTRVRYVGTLLELKIPNFLRVAQAFCM